MHEADIFCDATGVGMHPLEDLSNIPDPSYFRKDLIVTDTVYAPRETVMMKQAKEAGCTRVYNGMSMMLFQALIAIELYTGKFNTGGLHEGRSWESNSNDSPCSYTCYSALALAFIS